MSDARIGRAIANAIHAAWKAGSEVLRHQNTLDRLLHIFKLRDAALPRRVASSSMCPHLTTVRQPAVLLVGVLTGLMFLSFSVYDGGSTLAPYMTDDEKRKKKIRICVWALALLTISVYGGFIVFAMLADSVVAG